MGVLVGGRQVEYGAERAVPVEFVRAGVQHRRAHRPGRVQRGADEPALADPRLALHDDDLSALAHPAEHVAAVSRIAAPRVPDLPP
jgi:hypothetical protein